ncbi:MAG: hypothetical protein HFJ68_09750 [Adlercreutzia caecimuris]|jgi:hypothetical protein|uniref:hypothetical protein n=1 Tax=Adlercreutzia caecimuris TaxID=671266 RepID=UPI001364DE96|nr:hypothetical protein [Adlercreutzia caecimuris]MCI9208807.1 hypothetical protein [Adlercreutzia caecimuris]
MAREEAAAARGEAAFAGLVWEEVDGDAADGGAVGEGSPQGLDRPVPAGLGRPHPDRARQFSPFAALRGYYELVHERERVIESRRPLSEEEARALDATIADLQRGAMVRAVFYEKDAYRTIVGTVSQVDMIYHDLWIVRTRIPFASLCALEVIG